jgi:adenosine deaminase
VNDLTAFIEGMPTCELHGHIEETLEPEMKLHLARGNRVKLPYTNAKALKAAYAFNDLASFLGVYYEGMRILLSEQDFFDGTSAFLTKAGLKNVRNTGVQCIDHGVNALQDEHLCEEIKRWSLALTVCPISNAHVSDNSKAEAIKTMLAQGIRVTVNSDDPAYFAGYMTENLLRVQKEADLSRGKLAQLTENAFESAWLPRVTRDRYVAELTSYLQQTT